jgi:uncharacterized protein YcbX
VPVLRTGTVRQVRVWDDHCAAVDQGDAVAAWLSRVLGVEGARCVRMCEEEERQCSRHYAPRGSTTAFSDGFPLLLASEASLKDLNARLASRGKSAVPMERFRPNLVIDGKAPFEEDGWSRLRVLGKSGGDTLFGVVKPCARCKMPTIDQRTGVPDGRSSASATQVGSPTPNLNPHPHRMPPAPGRA